MYLNVYANTDYIAAIQRERAQTIWQLPASASLAAESSTPTLNDALATALVAARLKQQISGLAELKDNWDGYSSDLPNRAALQSAEEAVQYVGNVAARVVPVASAEGGVALCFTYRDQVGQIEFTNENEIIGLVYSSIDKPQAWDVQREDLAAAFDRVRGFFAMAQTPTTEGSASV